MSGNTCGVEALLGNGSRYAIGYTTTDPNEVSYLLNNAGFVNVAKYRQNSMHELIDQADMDIGQTILRHCKTNLEVDCSYVQLSEALRLRHDIGFMPMSRIRVYGTGNKTDTGILVGIIHTLTKELQNVALYSENRQSRFVKLWDDKL